MKRLLNLLGAAALACTATSCVEQDQKFTLNPDGSGKVVITTASSMAGALGGLGGLGGLDGGKSGGKLDAGSLGDEMTKGMLGGTIAEAGGIDAWSDLKITKGKDGKSRGTITGWFTDVNKVTLGSAMSGGKEGKGDAKAKPVLHSGKDAAGNWEIRLSDFTDDGAPAAPSETKPKDEAKPKLSAEEVEAKVAEMRGQWGLMKGLMSGFLTDMKISVSVKPSGTIKDTGALTSTGEGEAGMVVDGKKMLDLMDKVISDDKLAAGLAASGKGLDDLDPTAMEGMEKEFSKQLFGKDGEPRLLVTPGAPLLDFQAELAKAKAAPHAEIDALIAKAKEDEKNGKNPLNLNLGGDDDDDAPKKGTGKKNGKKIKID